MDHFFQLDVIRSPNDDLNEGEPFWQFLLCKLSTLQIIIGNI